MANSIIDKVEAEIEVSEAKLDKKKRIIEILKYFVIGIVILAEIIVLSNQIYDRFVPNNQYKEAVSLYNESKFEEALPIFEKLGNHRNSEYYYDLICRENPLLRFNNRMVGDEVKFGQYNSEYIDWIVVSSSKDKILLISKNIIEASTFPYETWFENFVKTSFTGNDKTIIENAYLFEVDDAEDYLEGKSFEKTSPTQHALSNSEYRRSADYGYGWWLNTTGSSGKYRVAGENGIVGYNTVNSSSVCGIRPALSVRLSQYVNSEQSAVENTVAITE